MAQILSFCDICPTLLASFQSKNTNKYLAQLRNIGLHGILQALVSSFQSEEADQIITTTIARCLVKDIQEERSPLVITSFMTEYHCAAHTLVHSLFQFVIRGLDEDSCPAVAKEMLHLLSVIHEKSIIGKNIVLEEMYSSLGLLDPDLFFLVVSVQSNQLYMSQLTR